jgi:hypothetical protein
LHGNAAQLCCFADETIRPQLSQLIPSDNSVDRGSDIYGPTFQQIQHERRMSQMNDDAAGDALSALADLGV